MRTLGRNQSCPSKSSFFPLALQGVQITSSDDTDFENTDFWQGASHSVCLYIFSIAELSVTWYWLSEYKKMACHFSVSSMQVVQLAILSLASVACSATVKLSPAASFSLHWPSSNYPVLLITPYFNVNSFMPELNHLDAWMTSQKTEKNIPFIYFEGNYSR